MGCIARGDSSGKLLGCIARGDRFGDLFEEGIVVEASLRSVGGGILGSRTLACRFLVVRRHGSSCFAEGENGLYHTIQSRNVVRFLAGPFKDGRARGVCIHELLRQRKSTRLPFCIWTSRVLKGPSLGRGIAQSLFIIVRTRLSDRELRRHTTFRRAHRCERTGQGSGDFSATWQSTGRWTLRTKRDIIRCVPDCHLVN